jgi:hypothetical protein
MDLKKYGIMGNERVLEAGLEDHKSSTLMKLREFVSQQNNHELFMKNICLGINFLQTW